MKRWLLLLGGPLLWGAHFLAIYAIASISVVREGHTSTMARALIAGAGAVGVLIAVLLLIAALRLPADARIDKFWRNVSAAGAAFALISIVWQTLPALAPI